MTNENYTLNLYFNIIDNLIFKNTINIYSHFVKPACKKGDNID